MAVTRGTFGVTSASDGARVRGGGVSERTGPLERARNAASRRQWTEAHHLFSEANAAELLGRADLPLVAQVAYAAGHLDLTIETWERLYAESVRAGDPLTAAGAAVRVAMHLLFDTALMGPVRGWLSRAERLLDGPGDTPVHAWLAVVRNYERMLAGDARGAREWARRAIEVGARCDPAAAAIGRVAEARNLILAGEVRDGLALLEEAGVATVSGELDPLSTGVVYCELVCALQGLSQFDLAEEWTKAMERWCAANAIGSIHGRCRVHRAEILRLRGFLVDAEKEVLVACEELRPYVRRELGWPLCELGRIRLRKGDIGGAEEALLAAHDVGWDAQPGLALVHLAQGDVALAAASIRDAIERPSHVPSKELPPDTDLRRAPLFEAQVEIAIAAGDLDQARAACGDLSRVAGRFESKAITASATLAHGRVKLAEGEAAEAERHFEEATRLWDDVGAPYEAALARMALAGAHRAQGHEPRAELEIRAARSILERIGALGQPERAAHVNGADEAEKACEPEKACAPPVDAFRREGGYWVVAFEGRTVMVRDLKGMRYVARLLAEPQREFHVLDLVADEAGVSASVDVATREPGLSFLGLGDAGPLLDARAKDAYRRRLSEIEEDIEEARNLGDSTRAAQADVERDLLTRELSRAVGLGGRDRRAGSASERARASVTRAVRQALLRVREHHKSLGTHLDRTIRTGTYCAYEPDPRASVAWKL
jgi:tetratricopeptide (TPR) repeat protein